MDQSLSSLAFKGSIIQAITEAKQQKKLFVVYLAGDNPESKDLETSTWTDPNVSEVLTKYCILLHILEGSSEASQFSAIYPQNSSPSITAVGYNGVKLWQAEGFVAAEVLASSFEKAWLSLHVQETTAAFLTAALASKQDLTSQTSERVLPEHGIAGINESSSSSTDNNVPSQGVGQLNSEIIEERNLQGNVHKEVDHNKKSEDSVQAPDANVSNSGALIASTSKTGSQNKLLNPQEIDQNTAPGGTSDQSDCHLRSIDITSAEIAKEECELIRNNAEKTTEVEEAPTSDSSTAKTTKVKGAHTSDSSAAKTTEVKETHTSDSSAAKSNDVFLIIRVPDGSSLQVKFSVMDTLRMVKDYVSDNLTSSFGSFDLATPYPRKVFHDHELDSTLSALGLINRQALILVSNKRKISDYRGGSSPNGSSSSNENAGYWASVRRILSYANPFSYFSSGNLSSPSGPQQSRGGVWQYSPNPSLQNSLRGAGSPSTDSSSTDHTGPANARKSRLLTSQFGSNIHTLKHDEDDDRSSDRNTFWNGNSTEFGGNDGK